MNNKKIIIKTIFITFNLLLFILLFSFGKVNNLKKADVLIIISLILTTSIILILYHYLFKNKAENNRKRIFEYLDLLTFITNVLTLLLILNTFVVLRARVEGTSMMPTLKHNDKVMARKNNLNIKNNDVVIYYDGSIYIVKRVHAIEGDLLEIKENELYVNDKKLIDKNNVFYDLNKFSKLYEFLKENGFKYTLKENEYLLLGDNAANSTDSREKGFILEKQIVGKVLWWF